MDLSCLCSGSPRTGLFLGWEGCEAVKAGFFLLYPARGWPNCVSPTCGLIAWTVATLQDSYWRVFGLLILLCFNMEGYAFLTMLEFSLAKGQEAWG